MWRNSGQSLFGGFSCFITWCLSLGGLLELLLLSVWYTIIIRGSQFWQLMCTTSDNGYELFVSFIEGAHPLYKRSSRSKYVFFVLFPGQRCHASKSGEISGKTFWRWLSCFKWWLNLGGLLEGLCFLTYEVEQIHAEVNLGSRWDTTIGCWYEIFIRVG